MLNFFYGKMQSGYCNATRLFAILNYFSVESVVAFRTVVWGVCVFALYLIYTIAF